MMVLLKEPTVVRETVQLLMEHGHMRLMELLLTVLTILEKFFVREDQDQLRYIQNLDVVEGHLIQMAFTHVVLKGAVLVLECIKKMTYWLSFQTVRLVKTK